MSAIITDQCYRLSPLVRRVTAGNGNIMTGPGTNTYLIGTQRIAVIDPGPNDQAHLQAIMDAVAAEGGVIDSIWVTHTHRDHSPGAAPLAAISGARLYGAVIPDDSFQDTTFNPDQHLQHDDVLVTPEYRLRAVHTPGHVDNHYCIYLEDEQMMFVGDHLMQGTTVVIIPPHGDMAAYINSLQLMLRYPLQAIAPGHGELLTEPAEIIEQTIEHRLTRERLTVMKLAKGPQHVDELVKRVYIGLDDRLWPMAKLSLTAHLIKLQREGRVKCCDQEIWTLLESVEDDSETA